MKSYIRLCQVRSPILRHRHNSLRPKALNVSCTASFLLVWPSKHPSLWHGNELVMSLSFPCFVFLRAGLSFSLGLQFLGKVFGTAILIGVQSIPPTISSPQFMGKLWIDVSLDPCAVCGNKPIGFSGFWFISLGEGGGGGGSLGIRGVYKYFWVGCFYSLLSLQTSFQLYDFTSFWVVRFLDRNCGVIIVGT